MRDSEENYTAIGVGVVGTRDARKDLIQCLPDGPRFKPVAFCDEGCEDQGPTEKPLDYHQDYNLLLKDPELELVLVKGPVTKRKDFAVRALNAGKHVVLDRPFCEESDGAERIMKTALRKKLVATCDLPGRNDPDYAALQNALREANVGGAYAIEGFRLFPPEARKREELLDVYGFEMLDQLQMLVSTEIKSVSTHVFRPHESRPAQHFMIHVAMRGDGWAALHGSVLARSGHPQWTAYTPDAIFTAEGGEAVLHEREGSTPLEAGPPVEDFWENLFLAIREEAPLKCHPADVVRAMKLHEATLESARVSEPTVL